jgi:hypothetical protein
VRWFEHQQITDMVLSARAGGQHAGQIALQPIVELIELIAGRFSKRGAGDETKRKSPSSFPPPR